MLILGIDPGTQILGYSLLDTEGGAFRIEAMDVLYLKKIADFNLRIRKIFDTTLRIIDGYHPDHLAIEAPFFGKNVQSMLKLGRAQGVAIAAAMSRDLSFTEYEPATIKQLVTGNGNASKERWPPCCAPSSVSTTRRATSMPPMPSPWPTPATCSSPTPWPTCVSSSSPRRKPTSLLKSNGPSSSIPTPTG